MWASILFILAQNSSCDTSVTGLHHHQGDYRLQIITGKITLFEMSRLSTSDVKYWQLRWDGMANTCMQILSVIELLFWFSHLYSFTYFLKNRLLFVYFSSFHIPIQTAKIYFELYKLKKHGRCAWDSNPGPQDDGHWRFHWALAAPFLVF